MAARGHFQRVNVRVLDGLPLERPHATADDRKSVIHPISFNNTPCYQRRFYGGRKGLIGLHPSPEGLQPPTESFSGDKQSVLKSAQPPSSELQSWNRYRLLRISLYDNTDTELVCLLPAVMGKTCLKYSECKYRHF